MKPIAYLDFDLQIERAGDGYRAQVLDSPAGNATHTFSLPFAPLELENYRLRLGAMRQGMRGGSSPEAETAKNFGGRLFETVFDGEVQGCLHSSLNMASQQGKGLRIRLRLTEAPDLLDLPWEYLYNRTRNLFYALSVETPLVRYLEMPERIMPLAITPPLRVLVMIASPKGYPPLNVEREWQKLHMAVRDLEDRGLMVLERIEQATLPALRRRLRTTDYHLFHFIGHGDFDPQTQDGALIFEDEDGLGFRASGQSLSVLMRDYRHPLRLVILNACEGARTAGSAPFAGTAQRLIQQGIPAVIAMQFEVTDETAITFAQEFYAALTDSFPVDAALTEARKAISIEARGAEWGTPVLYMRAPDGHIFDVAHIATAADTNLADPELQRAAGTPLDSPTNASQQMNETPAITASGVLTQAQPAAPALSPAAVVPAQLLEAPEGNVRLESPFYVPRTSDQVALRVIGQAGTTITIKGPRQIGKSSLLIRLADVARQGGKRVAFLDFQQFDRTALADDDRFFRQFCARLTYELGQENKVDEYWQWPFSNIMRCSDYLEEHLLARLNGPLVLAMDEVDRLFEAEFRSDFFGMLRSWHNERGANPIWRQLDLVLVTSTEPYQLIDNLNQSPFNVGEVIEIADFTPAQIAELNARHGSPLTSGEVERLTALVGGHPYLARKALYEVAIGHTSAAQLFQDATSDQSPFAIHLSHHLMRLQQKEELARGMIQVIRASACPDDRIFFRLHSAGLVRRDRGAVVPRCQLYADYFRERLHV